MCQDECALELLFKTSRRSPRHSLERTAPARWWWARKSKFSLFVNWLIKNRWAIICVRFVWKVFSLSFCALLSSMISMSRSELIMALAAATAAVLKLFFRQSYTVDRMVEAAHKLPRIHYQITFFFFLTHFCLSSAAFPTFKRKEIGKKITLFILLISLSRERGSPKSEPIITTAKWSGVIAWSENARWVQVGRGRPLSSVKFP